MTALRSDLRHLLAMSDAIGTFEHADHADHRRTHGYCTDDMARVLVVLAREPQLDPAGSLLARRAMRFLADAQGVDGKVRNRRSANGRWTDPRRVEDPWGRSLWAFGTAANRTSDALRQDGLAYFDHGAKQRSAWPRSMAFAALGAAEVLERTPGHAGARSLLVDAVTAIGRPRLAADWPWPEDRLSYANAVLAEALLAAGHALDRPDVADDGLVLLSWLVARETVGGHLSPTPAGGAGPGDGPGRFDQQPIEVAALADACARAAAITGDATWWVTVEQAARWFDGDNDLGTPMWDAGTGGGFDGLMAHGANQNQGAESTLALLSTRQLVRAPRLLAA